MHSTSPQFGHPFSGDFERVLRTHKLVSPRIMAVIAVVVALVAVGVAAYVTRATVVVAAKVIELRPELFKNPYGEVIAIREADGTIVTPLDQGFGKRLRQIGDSYEVVAVGLDWHRPAKK